MDEEEKKEESTEEVKCEHMHTTAIPVKMGYIERCLDCFEVVEKKEYQDV